MLSCPVVVQIPPQASSGERNKHIYLHRAMNSQQEQSSPQQLRLGRESTNGRLLQDEDVSSSVSETPEGRRAPSQCTTCVEDVVFYWRVKHVT